MGIEAPVQELEEDEGLGGIAGPHVIRGGAGWEASSLKREYWNAGVFLALRARAPLKAHEGGLPGGWRRA